MRLMKTARLKEMVPHRDILLENQYSTGIPATHTVQKYSVRGKSTEVLALKYTKKVPKANTFILPNGPFRIMYI